MKKLTLTPLLLITILTSFFVGTKTVAQSTNHCYMEDTNGGLIDLSSLCGGSPSTLPSQNRGNARSFEVKIKRRQQGIPIIDVLFEGKKTYEMLVDTGASGTVLTVRMAEELNLKPERYVLVQTPSSQAVKLRSTTIKSIRVGSGKISNVEVIVSPALRLGLLGQDFLARYNITIKQDTIKFQRR